MNQTARNGKETASQPNETLKMRYTNYIAMQACHESRKEFRVKYVTAQEFNDARSIARRDEQALLKQFPALVTHKDGLWEQAKMDFGNTNLAVTLAISGTKHNAQALEICRAVAIGYTADSANQQQKIKKDL